MPSPTWCSTDGRPALAAAIAAAVFHAWDGPEEGASNRFVEALRQMVGPDELERVEMLALRVLQEQPRAPEGLDIPPSVHLQICPGCQKLRRTRHTIPQNGRLKLQALRDPEWLAKQFARRRTCKAIAEQLGCSPSLVIYWADKHGLKPPRRQAQADFDLQVATLHNAGEGPGTIARELETTVARIRTSLARQELATRKRGHHYFEAEWWRVRLEDRGLTKAAAAREAGLKAHGANYYLDKFDLQHLVVPGRTRQRKYPQLFDPVFLRDLLRRHGDSYESAASEIGCAATLISTRARDLLGREKKHSNNLPHSSPDWWRERLDAGLTTQEMADEADVKEGTARERLRLLGWLDEGYRNNYARERQEREKALSGSTAPSPNGGKPEAADVREAPATRAGDPLATQGAP